MLFLLGIQLFFDCLFDLGFRTERWSVAGRERKKTGYIPIEVSGRKRVFSPLRETYWYRVASCCFFEAFSYVLFVCMIWGSGLTLESVAGRERKKPVTF